MKSPLPEAWERAIHGLHPATLLLASAQRRLDRAHALLRAARGGTDNGVTKEEITPAANEEPSVSQLFTEWRSGKYEY
jgi:hypothetical protein